MIISTKRQEADFYIARVGSKAGMPMRENYTGNNAFCVMSKDPVKDFQVALHLYRSNLLSPYIFGTCQVSIRKRDLQKLLDTHVVNENVLIKMVAVDNLIQLKKQELNKLYELQSAIGQLNDKTN